MISNRSSDAMHYLNTDTIQNSLLEWVESFQIEDPPYSYSQLFQGVAIYQILNKIDHLYWPKQQLQKQATNSAAQMKNFKQILGGLEQYYQQKLDLILPVGTVDLDKLVGKNDFACFVELMELVTGVIVNCDDKELYIQKIMTLPENTQEDLQKLIERSLTRMQIELSEASAYTDHANDAEAFQRSEKEKKLMKERISELENELKLARKDLKARDEKIKMLSHQLEIAQMEKDTKSSRSELDLSGLKGLSELEGQLKFKEQELSEYKSELDNQKNLHKAQIKELKEDLAITKERLIKFQKNDAQAEVIKMKNEEYEEMEERIGELQDKNFALETQSKKYEQEVAAMEQYKEAVEFLKNDAKESKSQKHVLEMEMEKVKAQLQEKFVQNGKNEVKNKKLEEKVEQLLEELEITRSKLQVYEEHGLPGRGLNELAELNSTVRLDHDELEDMVRDLEKENKILKMKDRDELNMKVLQLETAIDDGKRQEEKLKYQLEVKDKHLLALEQENERMRAEVVNSKGAKERNDQTKEMSKLVVERDTLLDKISKLQKKLQKKIDKEKEYQAVGEQKSKLEEELRKALKEKGEEISKSGQLNEAKINLSSQVSELESKVKQLSTDNQTLEANLIQIKQSQDRISPKKSEQRTFQFETELKMLQLEKERDQLKWNEERTRLHVQIEKNHQLLQSKEFDIQNKEEQCMLKFRDQQQMAEQSYFEDLQDMQQKLLQKENEFLFFKSQKEEGAILENKRMELVASNFYNLGLAHFHQQNKRWKQGDSQSWLDKQRSTVYSHGYEYIFNPN